MKEQNRLPAVISAGFLLLFGLYLLGSFYLAQIFGLIAVAASLIVLGREVAFYIIFIARILPPEDFTGADAPKKEEEKEDGTTH